jgi:lipopolysaccharide transport system permease protein
MKYSASSTQAGWADWWAGTRNVDLWWTLAWYETVLRYRRSLLGPLWITLSMGALLLGMGPLYSTLFNVPIRAFYPHLTLGIIFWNFLSTSINESCVVFITAAPYMKQGEFPRSIFVWKNLAKQVIQLAHHILLYVPVAIWAGIGLSPRMLAFVPGFLLVLVNLHALSITLGIICARFRDVPQIIASMLQLLMFLTPVFWLPDSLPRRIHLILYNPLAQMLDAMRVPLLGGVVAPGTWRLLAVFTIVNFAVAGYLYATKRRQIVYYV